MHWCGPLCFLPRLALVMNINKSRVEPWMPYTKMSDNIKQRFFPQMSEVLRIRIDVRRLVGQIRGEQYVRLQAMRGEDFTYVVVRRCLHLYSVRLLSIFETLTYYLKAKFAIDVSAAELSADLSRRAPVSVSYTLLDVLFICILCHDDNAFPCHFVDQGRILSLPLIFVPQIDRLSYHGECCLAY